jgi:signal transduction histidine kinase
VEDQGIGISEQDRDRVFERFERGVSQRHSSGLGLGLFIVRQIVEAHGGKIWFESELGKGTKFTVELPLMKEKLHAKAA